MQRGAERVGFASVADINRYAPPGHRPDDFLSGAKSVIVIAGRPATRGALHSCDYRSFSANLDFFRIRGGIALDLAKYIESKYGYYAIADTPPPTGLNASLSLKLCAEMAGLGTRCMAGGIILNREMGVINLAAIVTTLPLPADGLMVKPVCPHPSCVKRWEKDYAMGRLDNEPTCDAGWQERIEQLERMVGRLTMENEVLKKALKQAILKEQQNDKSSALIYPPSEVSKGGAK